VIATLVILRFQLSHAALAVFYGVHRSTITRNGRPEAVIISVADLETIEETLDLLSTPGALDEIRTAEADIGRGQAIGADELRRLVAERIRSERDAG
jgi:antitoxin YefM